MHLASRLYTKSCRIDYDFNPGTGVHTVWSESGVRSRGSAGQAINALVPFRDNPDVRELIAWLSGF